RYFSSTSLEDIIIDDIDVFWRQTNAQVQILDLNGNVRMDSIGASHQSNIDTKDILKALEGEKGTWIGDVEYSNSQVMAVSHPLIVEGKTIGVLRFVTSLKETNRIIMKITFILLLAGLIVVLISGAVSVFLANTMIKPIEEVT